MEPLTKRPLSAKELRQMLAHEDCLIEVDAETWHVLDGLSPQEWVAVYERGSRDLRERLAYKSAVAEVHEHILGLRLDVDYLDRGLVLHNLAENPAVSSAVLARLSRDWSGEIRKRVAKHHNTSPDILDGLARDSEADVRVAVCLNPNTPDSTVELVIQSDRNALDRVARAEDLRLVQIVAKHHLLPSAGRLADNPITPTSVLHELVRVYLGGTQLGPHALKSLVQHPNIAGSDLADLVDVEFRLARLAVCNPAASAEFLHKWVSFSGVVPDPQTKVEYRYVVSKDTLVGVVRNPNTGAVTLEFLIDSVLRTKMVNGKEVSKVMPYDPDESWGYYSRRDIAKAILRHPNATLQTLDRLRDLVWSDWHVRASELVAEFEEVRAALVAAQPPKPWWAFWR